MGGTEGARGVWSQGLRAPVPCPLSPTLPTHAQGLTPAWPWEKRAGVTSSLPSSLPEPGPGGQGAGGPVSLGPRQAWEAATWGKWLSQPQPHTSASFPWLHCFLAPQGSVTLSTAAAGTALALTLAVTPPGPWQLPVDPTAAEPTQPQAVPLPGQPQSWVSGWEGDGDRSGRGGGVWKGGGFCKFRLQPLRAPLYQILSFQGRGL